MKDKPPDVTGLLQEWRSGNADAANQLMELLYGELHEMAARQVRREHGGHTLQTTALVHEAYLRLCGSQPVEWRDRGHFYAIAARQMRRVLIDHARRAGRDKRGGDRVVFSLDDFDGASPAPDERLLALDEALTRLEALDERAAKVVELRYFGGLSETETAEALQVSVATMKRDWDFARTWLASRLM